MIDGTGKVTRVLLAAVLIMAILIVLKSFLIPLTYGFLLAIIIYPVCHKLEKNKVPRSIAVFISLMIILVIVGLIVFVFILQVQALNKDLPQLTQRVIHLLAQAQVWMSSHFGISPERQNELVIDMGKNFSSSIGGIVRGSFSAAAAAVVFLVIVPLYTVLFLAYRGVLVDFLSSLIGSKYNGDLPGILSEVIHSYFKYVKGMFFVYLIVGILNSIGLLLLGVDHAILFGMVTAFMTIIPYIGIIVSSILPITVVWAETNNILYPLGVVAVFTFVQYLEANIIFPYVVGKQIDLNMLVSICTILAGGVIWGVHGMLLFLPFVAFAKIISAHFEGLRPIYKLLRIPDKPGKKK